ncbi:MAG: amidohydrolase family protein [Porticoccaceae bacterium]|jgi:imidazolonepropionase-like amidohydrolase|nr:amidohydrolase family protein [Porticoccaceae bacterium]MBT3798827.1 amidohydrolase family protein [Porticoccaceae bacterium]MBT4163656.1 amidohydrolase family protein [Porticoccaceae bacterium]MBT4211048.1 amidohydrolase family protein [Porticoccaceae bacterium]MBT4590841.1 amidohydrolase family protein [Porticoccaceae bacterium]
MPILNTLRLALIILTITLISNVSAEQYALVSDSVIDGKSNELLKNKAVIVTDSKITGIVAIGLIPEQAVRVNLPGTTLMPGMINAHEHPLLYKDDYQNGHLQASSAYKALLGLSNLQGLLKAGWTTIRVMGDGDVYYANQDLKKAINVGVFIGPRLTGAAHYISITGGGGDVNYLSPEQNVIADGLIADGPDEIRKAIRTEIKYGSDWIKIMVTGAFMSVGDNPKNVSFSPEELRAAIEEASRHNIPVAAHAHATDGVNQAIIAGARSIEHGSYLDEESIALMVKHQTYYVPTIYVGDYYANSGKLLAQSKNDDFYLSFRDDWLQMIGKAYRAGVKIAVGSDLCGYAVEPHVCAREFATLVEAGLSPMDAIKAGTSVGAELLQWDDQIGSIEVDKLADIIAVPGNPLLDISALERPVFVMKNGQIIINALEKYSAINQ